MMFQTTDYVHPSGYSKDGEERRTPYCAPHRRDSGGIQFRSHGPPWEKRPTSRLSG